MGTSIVFGTVVGSATATAVATCFDDVPQAGFLCGGIVGLPVGVVAGELAHCMESVRAMGEGGWKSWSEHQYH